MQDVIISLLLTIGLEFAVYCLWFRRKILTLLLYAVLINAATQPFANFFYNNVIAQLWLIEICVCLVEAGLLWQLLRLPFWQAVLLSLVANAVTTLAGVIIYWSYYFP